MEVGNPGEGEECCGPCVKVKLVSYVYTHSLISVLYKPALGKQKRGLFYISHSVFCFKFPKLITTNNGMGLFLVYFYSLWECPVIRVPCHLFPPQARWRSEGKIHLYVYSTATFYTKQLLGSGAYALHSRPS
jgi:hypothetical protein